MHIAGSEYQGFVKWLNNQSPGLEPCQICFLPGYDTVMGPDGEIGGFACYAPSISVIYVAADPSEALLEDIFPTTKDQFIQECIIHEFLHHRQKCEGVEYSEEQAENAARCLMGEWLSRALTHDHKEAAHE